MSTNALESSTALERKHSRDEGDVEVTAGRSLKAARHSSSFLEFTGTETVDLYVGFEKKLFRVHKQVICQKISYFDSIFNDESGKPRQTTAEFPEDSPIAFDVLLEWAYHGHLRTLTSADNPSKSRYDACAAYFLFEKLGLPKLMNLLMGMIRDYQRKHNRFFSPHTIRKVYQNTRVHSPLRKYCLHTLHYVIERNPTPHISGGFTSTALLALLQENPDLLNDHITLMLQQHGVHVENPNLTPDSQYHAEVSRMNSFLKTK